MQQKGLVDEESRGGLRLFVLLDVRLGDVVRDGGGWWIGGDEKRVLKVGGLALRKGGDAASDRSRVATAAEPPMTSGPLDPPPERTGAPLSHPLGGMLRASWWGRRGLEDGMESG